MSNTKEFCYDCGRKKETTELLLEGKDAWGNDSVIHVCWDCFESRRYEEEDVIDEGRR